jgi:hypothetical protein
VVKCHVDQVRKANIADWGLPKTIPPGTRPIRNCRYVVPPEKTEDSSSCDESDSADQPVLGRKLTGPKRRLVKMHQHVRTDSSDEENIPLRELQMRLRQASNDNNVPGQDNALSLNIRT